MIINKIYRKLFTFKNNIISKTYKIHLKLLYGKSIQINLNSNIHKTVEFDISPFNSNIIIDNNCYIRKYCTLRTGHNGQIFIGENVFFNASCSINSFARINIGDNTIFGENVLIYDHNHKFWNKKAHIIDQGYNSKPINIGKNSWIGSGCIILQGASIGDNCIIGAGNVIYKNIPNNTMLKNKQNYEKQNW